MWRGKECLKTKSLDPRSNPGDKYLLRSVEGLEEGEGEEREREEKREGGRKKRRREREGSDPIQTCGSMEMEAVSGLSKAVVCIDVKQQCL